MFLSALKKSRILKAFTAFAAVICCAGNAATAAPVPTASYVPERAPAAVPVPSKSEVLTKLRNLQARQIEALTLIEDSLKKELKNSTQLNLRTEDLNVADSRVTRSIEQMSVLDQRRNEMIARRDLTDRLILSVDTRYDGKESLQAFMEHQLLDLAQTDLTGSTSSSAIWKFATYMSVVIREIPEPQEDPIGVLESYMNFSTVMNPRSPTLYLANRNYSNGSISEAAKPVPREMLGDYVEKSVGPKTATLRPNSKTPTATISASRQSLRLTMQPLVSPTANATPAPTFKGATPTTNGGMTAAESTTPGSTVSGATTSSAPTTKPETPGAPVETN